MNHLVVAPIVLTALMAGLLILAFRHHLVLQRVFSVGGVVLLIAFGLWQALEASTDTISVYALSDWPAPFGIVLVLDRLSALMVLLTSVLALPVILYAIGSGWDTRGQHFHPLFHFQLMGICGAFLTGDLFNLFVFFEVLLIASYGLVIHAGGARRLRAGVQYVIYNLLGSTLFLFALAVLYSVTGTLNMADMAERVAALPADDTAMLRVGAVFLMLVFAIKASILPLHFWLPETYAQSPAPVAALFAIMTKVGAYAILRVDTLIFGPETSATAGMMTNLILTGGLLTLAIGMIGVLGARTLGSLAAFATIGSVGTLLASLALFTPQSSVAALYYTIHSTLAGALLFLIVDMVRERRGPAGDALVSAPPIASTGFISVLYFIAAIAVAGMPPLSGFVGKLLILDAVRADATMWLIWTVVLVGSLFAILGFAQAGSRVFWKTEAGEAPDPDTALPDPGDLKPLALPATATGALLGAIIALTIFAGPTTRYLEATAAQLYTPKNYIDAVYGQEPVAAPYPGAKPTPNRILEPKNGPGAGTETPRSKGDG